MFTTHFNDFVGYSPHPSFICSVKKDTRTLPNIRSINEDQSTEETGKIGTFIYITDCFYTNPSGFYFGTGRKMDSFYVIFFMIFMERFVKFLVIKRLPQ